MNPLAKLPLRAALASTLLALPPACTPARAPAGPPVVLHAADGAAVPFDEAVRSHAFTVVTFFSAVCPCQRAHDARLRDLIAAFAPRDVGFLVVDSESTGGLARDRDEGAARGYPIVRDEGGALATRFDAEYATFSVVVDRSGKVVYRGGIDSDKSHLRDSRTPYLADALDDALAGRPLRVAEAKTLGCVLQVR